MNLLSKVPTVIFILCISCFANQDIATIKINPSDIKKIDANANGANFRIFCIGELAFISTPNSSGGDTKQLFNKVGGALTCDEAKKVLSK